MQRSAGNVQHFVEYFKRKRKLMAQQQLKQHQQPALVLKVVASVAPRTKARMPHFFVQQCLWQPPHVDSRFSGSLPLAGANTYTNACMYCMYVYCRLPKAVLCCHTLDQRAAAAATCPSGSAFGLVLLYSG